VTRPQVTVRARLTLLYTGLFTVCGVIVVAVSYILVAQLDPSQQGPQPSDRNVPASVAAQCGSELANPHPDSQAAAKCNNALLYQGALHQRDLTRSHLLEYSLITLAVVIALAAILGWILSGRALRPVQRIAATARAASHHNLADRVALHGPRDELRELAETFDEMLDRL
jgi:HAMP domain-containing protein